MERNDKIKKIVGIIIISSMILFNAIVIFREDIKLDRIIESLKRPYIKGLSLLRRRTNAP